MIYPYMVLPDETEIVHTGIIHKDDGDHVEVHFERPTDKGFDTARCSLPEYNWLKKEGNYSDDEMAFFNELLKHHAHLIFKYAKSGGICCA